MFGVVEQVFGVVGGGGGGANLVSGLVEWVSGVVEQRVGWLSGGLGGGG